MQVENPCESFCFQTPVKCANAKLRKSKKNNNN